MPPKGKRGGKGKKGKGKRGGKKKGKKPPKKFARLMFEEEYIWNKGRGELEVIAETLQRQVTIERSERIRFAYEREWLFEMTKVYLQKIREVRKRNEFNFTSANRDAQDLEEQKLINRINRKQIQYGTLMRVGAIEMRDHKRMKHLRKLIPLEWELTHEQSEICDALIAGLPRLFARSKKLKRSTLEPLSNRLKKIHDDAQRLTNIYNREIKRLLKQNTFMFRSELLGDYDTMTKTMNKSHSAFSLRFVAMKNFMIDMVHNVLNVILTILDHWEDLHIDSVWLIRSRKLYDKAHSIMFDRLEAMRLAHLKRQIKALEYGRAIQGLDTTYKSIDNSATRLEFILDRYQESLLELHEVQALIKMGCVEEPIQEALIENEMEPEEPEKKPKEPPKVQKKPQVLMSQFFY